MIKAVVSPIDKVVAKTICKENLRANIREVYLSMQVFPFYDGSYEVIPSEVEQRLQTSGKTMRDNVTVHPVPFAVATRSQIDHMF